MPPKRRAESAEPESKRLKVDSNGNSHDTDSDYLLYGDNSPVAVVKSMSDPQTPDSSSPPIPMALCEVTEAPPGDYCEYDDGYGEFISSTVPISEVDELKQQIATLTQDRLDLMSDNLRLRRRLNDFSSYSEKSEAGAQQKYSLEFMATISVAFSQDKIESLKVDSLVPFTSHTPECSSLSSGAIADVSSESSGSMPAMPSKIPTSSSSSSGSSATSRMPRRSTILQPNQLPKPDKCICTCFCQKFFEVRECHTENVVDSSTDTLSTPPTGLHFPMTGGDLSKLVTTSQRSMIRSSHQSTPKRVPTSFEETGFRMRCKTKLNMMKGPGSGSSSPSIISRYQSPKRYSVQPHQLPSSSSSSQVKIKSGQTSNNEEDEFPIFPVEIKETVSLGGGDLDYEVTISGNLSNRKSIGAYIKKSSTKDGIRVEEPDETVALLGPIPTSPIFYGYSFVITSGGPYSIYKTEKNSDHDSSDRSDVDVLSAPFDRVRLRAQIIAGGGTVFSDIVNAPRKALKNNKLIVISDAPCRTAAYLLAVAANIPIYSHQFIINCTMENKMEILPQRAYQLPLGRLVSGTLIMFQSGRRIQLFSGFRIALAVSRNNKRTDFWVGLMRFMGANVSVITKDDKEIINMKSLHGIIVDDFITPCLRDAAKQFKLMLHSTKLLVDLLLGNKSCFSQITEVCYLCQISDSDEEN